MAAITFSNLAPDDLGRVANFASLPLHASLSYRSQIESRWVDEIKELLSNENAVGFVAQAGATVRGLAICAPLAWESPLLGKSMWTIKHICVAIRRSDRICIATGLVEETLRRIGARDADFLLCKAMPSDTDIIHALESNGFLLMDTLLNFVFDCRAGRSNDRPQQMPEGFVLRLATSSDVELLAQVAHSSFAGHFGRFHADPRIGHAAATKIYEEWIRSCANGWADWIEAPTHIDNHVVQRVFLRLGLRIAGAQHSFHKWLKA